MEVWGAQLLHSLDGTKNHPFVGRFGFGDLPMLRTAAPHRRTSDRQTTDHFEANSALNQPTATLQPLYTFLDK